MEWPELIEEILPAGTVRIRIAVDSNEQRILLIS
jgi:tRNA A37 threonylcarbamoyladenosine biosynthesis protein TsaE